MGAYAFDAAGKPAAVIEDRACAVEEAQRLIEGLDAPVILLGDGAYLLQSMADGDRIVMSDQNQILGKSVAHAAMFLESAPPERLVPAYFRLSQAEREYQMKKEQKENGSIGL